MCVEVWTPEDGDDDYKSLPRRRRGRCWLAHQKFAFMCTAGLIRDLTTFPQKGETISTSKMDYYLVNFAFNETEYLITYHIEIDFKISF